MADRSVILLATNKQTYLDFAHNCAYSIRLHNPHLAVYIATNINERKSYAGVSYIDVRPDVAKLNICAKIYLDELIQTDETLFIDSDCLCYGSLAPVFEACQGHYFTTIGRVLSRLATWGPENSKKGIEQFGTDKFIINNGAMYYIKKSDITQRIFDKAKEFYETYDFWEHEEPLLTFGMALNDQEPIKDDATLLSNIDTDRRPRILNVLTGARVLRNYTRFAKNPHEGYPDTFSPLILHYGGASLQSYPYMGQSFLLKMHQNGVPVAVASALKYLFLDIPFKTYHAGRYWLGKLFSSKDHTKN